jgi:hypothetical protein
MAYPEKHNYNDRAPPLLNAEHLNEMEDGIDNAHKAIDNVTIGHHHDGADSRKVSHVDLLAKGVNTHSQIDVHLAAANPHSGSASDADLASHTSDTSNPHSVTAAQLTGASIVTEINSSVGILDDNNIAASIARDSEVSAYFNVTTGHDHDGTDSKKIPDGSLASGTTVASAGAGDSGKLVKLDAAGHVDATAINDGDISHLSIGDIGTNAHSVIDTHLGASNPHSGSAASGSNSDITQLSGLTTDLSIAQGGTGQSAALAAFDALKQLATETYAGATERATTSEDVTGTATDVATTPAGLTERLKSPGEIGGTAAAAATFTSVDSPYITRVKEEDTSAISKGQVLCITGVVGGMIKVGLANCIDAIPCGELGLAFTDIAQNSPGDAQIRGILTSVDTRSTNTDINPNAETWVAGDLLYLDDTNGGMTNVRPTSGRIVRLVRTLNGSAVNDDLYILGIKDNSAWSVATSGEDVVLRVGDNGGANKVSIRDYADNEVASINSDGIGQIRGNVSVTKTDVYNVQIADFGKTIRVNSAIDKTMSLPSVGATEDGARLTFIKLGAGKVTIGAADTDKFFGGSGGGTMHADVEIGASITIEYVDAITMWTIVAANGTWTIT